MIFDEIICHRTLPAPSCGGAILVSVFVGDEEGDRLLLEQHVFLPACGRHLHGVSYQRLEEDTVSACRERAVAATRRLLARHLEQEAGHCFVWDDAENESRVARARPPEISTEEPFHDFHLAGEFLGEMQEIMDWTGSARLRAVLVGLLAYRSDPAEARVLSRVFAGGGGLRHQTAGR